MFTLQAIEAAHSHVKSGADFPAYIQEIKQMGVQRFVTWVYDSHTNYYGEHDFELSSPSLYEKIEISKNINADKFKYSLKIHQQGETNYSTFCTHCAETGIEKWVVDLDKMTCIYFDHQGLKFLLRTYPNYRVKYVIITSFKQ